MSAIANNNVNNNNNIFHEIKRKLEELNSDIVVSDEMQRNPVYKRGISKDFIRRLLQSDARTISMGCYNNRPTKLSTI